ncbi:MAG: hypothetical protein HONBIEJF_00666 [Fimbriimonadaceae bacterium]|nr:hypothetical protein [Fimbriimonadaceae bacterium]
MVVASLAGLAMIAGCQNEQQATPQQLVTTYSASDQLKPDGLPYTKANLILAGTLFPVEMSRAVNGTTVKFTLTAHDEVIEEEIYESTKEKFAILDLAGETYKPALPLLQFPIKPGDVWKWQGEMIAGGIVRKATAKVTISEDKLNLADGVYETLKSSVELEMPSGGPTPAKRILSFWFVKEKGMIKRDIAASSTREPRAAQE